MSKLTLSVDDEVISRAKRYANRQGVSISKMVEAYLAAVAEPATGAPEDTPILRSVRGVLKSADVKDYQRHLTRKYR
jgi:antitoxin component of RelBE/YafQ-DinJ toxin-antitoxin module